MIYVWDFGDGTTSREINPIHIYTMPGVYTVTLSEYINGVLNSKTIRENYIRVYDYYYGDDDGINVSKTDLCLRLGIQKTKMQTKEFIPRKKKKLITKKDLGIGPM